MIQVDQALPPEYSSHDPLAPLPDIIASRPWHTESVSYIGDQLTHDDMVTVLSHIAKNASVKKLYLAGNNASLSDEVMPVLYRSLRVNTTITYLNLASCAISSRGAAILGIVLRTNTTIDTLLLQDNSIVEEGAIAFAKSIGGPSRSEQNLTLKVLNLSGNAIMDSGFAPLAHGIIRSLVGLKELHLGANALSDNSTMILSHLVLSHPSLQYLYLQGNRFTNSAVLAVDRVIKPSFILVSFMYNTGITLRTNSVSNKSRIWWKPKHERKFNNPSSMLLPLSRSHSWV
eukprot:jgi/Hompol1/2315/HPOL_002200-RA